MSAIPKSSEPPHGNSFLLAFGLLTVAVMIFSVLLATVKPLSGAPVVSIRYGDLPLSEHALTDHAGEKWNAASIAAYFDSGGCIPKEYSCMAQDFRVVYCKLNGKKSIGLIIGLTVQQIVTGFMGNTSYWANRCGQ